MDVAEVVRTARRHAGWTQQELARAAGTSQAAISDIERGQSGVSVERLDRILSAMGYRLEALPKDDIVDPHDLELIRLNLLLTPAQRLAQLTNRMRLRGLARR